MYPPEKFTIRAVTDADRAMIQELVSCHWGAPEVVSRGHIHRPEALPGFIAERAGQVIGLVTYHVGTNSSLADRAASAPQEGAPECEIVTLDSLHAGVGVGSALISAVRQAAKQSSCRRLWLITTNDNLPALRFYQKRGFRLVTIHRDAIRRSRQLKPSISYEGLDGIPILDEIELEMPL